jgi:hypothetical protein
MLVSDPWFFYLEAPLLDRRTAKKAETRSAPHALRHLNQKISTHSSKIQLAPET